MGKSNFDMVSPKKKRQGSDGSGSSGSGSGSGSGKRERFFGRDKVPRKLNLWEEI